MRTKIAIVGAGIIGLSIGFEALKNNMEVTIFEESSELGRGASGHNAGVIHVIQTPFNSWKSKLAKEGNPIYDTLSKEMGFRLKRVPALLIFRNSFEKIAALIASYYLKSKGFDVKVIDKKEVMSLCQDISPKIKGAIKVEGYGTVVPLEVLNSLADFLEEKGAQIKLREKVIKIDTNNNKVNVMTNWSNEDFNYVIISAGGSALSLSKNLDPSPPKLEYAKGVMVITKLNCNAILSLLFSKTRSEKTKGGGVIPWPNGKTILGPSFEITNDPWDTSYTKEEIDLVVKNYEGLLKEKPKVLGAFSGTRIKAPPKYDFVVKVKKKYTVLYGIDSPGFTAAPALARHIVSNIVKMLKS